MPEDKQVQNFADILKKKYNTDDINSISDDDLMATMGDLGYDRRTARDVTKGFNKYKKGVAGGRNFNFLEGGGGKYDIAGEGGFKETNSGRRKGQAVGASGVSNFLGTGSDVSSFAGFLTNMQKAKLEAKAAEEEKDNQGGGDGGGSGSDDGGDGGGDGGGVKSYTGMMAPTLDLKGLPDVGTQTTGQVVATGGKEEGLPEGESGETPWWMLPAAIGTGTAVIGGTGYFGGKAVKSAVDMARTAGMSELEKQQYYYQKDLENRKMGKPSDPLFDYPEEEWMKTGEKKPTTKSNFPATTADMGGEGVVRNADMKALQPGSSIPEFDNVFNQNNPNKLNLPGKVNDASNAGKRSALPEGAGQQSRVGRVEAGLTNAELDTKLKNKMNAAKILSNKYKDVDISTLDADKAKRVRAAKEVTKRYEDLQTDINKGYLKVGSDIYKKRMRNIAKYAGKFFEDGGKLVRQFMDGGKLPSSKSESFNFLR